jgi:hypothetical protein
MAAQGLIEDDALEISAEMQSLLATYVAVPFITNFKAMIDDMQANLYIPDDPLTPLIDEEVPGIQQSVIDAFAHQLDDVPFLSDVIPLASDIDATYFSEYIINHANNITGNGSNSVFITHLMAVNGFIKSANQYINSAANSSELSAQTFTSMDSLVTGNITSVNKYTQAFGQDLINTGSLYNFRKLHIFGSPQALVERLIAYNLLTLFVLEFEFVGIDVYSLQEALADNPNLVLKPSTQKRCYAVFENITDQRVQDVLYVLGIQVPGITILSDLLNISKMFPESASTMTSMNNGVIEHIFSASGGPSRYVIELSTDWALMMPPEIAKASKAFAIALGQIKNIHTTTAVALGEQAQSLETNLGLDKITSLATAMPADAADYFISSMGNGTGPNGMYLLTDGVGTPAGLPHIETFTTILNVITELQESGELDLFNEIITVMRDVFDDVYLVTDPDPLIIDYVEIPVPLPAAGIYTDNEEAINALMTELDLATVDLIANNTELVNAANAAYQQSIDHSIIELQTLAEANIQFEVTYTTLDAGPNFGKTKPSKQSALSFAGNLHTHGQDTTQGGVVFIMENMATSDRSGQALIGAMREGRNLKKLTAAGIVADNKISDSVDVPKTDVLPSTYTA